MCECVSLEFVKVVNIVKLDMLGVDPYEPGSIEGVIRCQAYNSDAEEFELAMEALSYCILHVAKMNAVTEEAFEAAFESMALKPEL